MPVKVLLEDEIRKAIKRCKPAKIAVAYIGDDWNRYIPDVNGLEAIIVSPTFGSNPRAIIDLAKKIGWDKVYFLDELHAKIYVGPGAAVIGSANLTCNGLSGEGLIELCVEVNARETLNKLDTAFERLKECALRQYPTTDLKKARLIKLEKAWGTAIANRIIKNPNGKSTAFIDFEPLGEDHFYVLWYQPDVFKYSKDLEAIKPLIVDDTEV